MPMTSMKIDEGMNHTGMVEEPNPYGYGLVLCLDEARCEALGIKTPLQAGTKVRIEAMAYVKSATGSTEHESEGHDPRVRMDLQITDLGLTPSSQFYDKTHMG